MTKQTNSRSFFTEEMEAYLRENSTKELGFLVLEIKERFDVELTKLQLTRFFYNRGFRRTKSADTYQDVPDELKAAYPNHYMTVKQGRLKIRIVSSGVPPYEQVDLLRALWQHRTGVEVSRMTQILQIDGDINNLEQSNLIAVPRAVYVRLMSIKMHEATGDRLKTAVLLCWSRQFNFLIRKITRGETGERRAIYERRFQTYSAIYRLQESSYKSTGAVV